MKSTNKIKTVLLFIAGMSAAVSCAASRAEGESALKLHYRAPAAKWVEALPVGNGRIGAMVFGGVAEDRIQLNEATLWSGGPRDWNNPGAKEYLPIARKAVFEGRYADAEAAMKKMMGPYTQSYMPMGNLYLRFPVEATPTRYYRDLNIDNAIATTRYTIDGVAFTREVFVSYPDQVLAVILTSSKKGALTFDASLDSLLKNSVAAAGQDTIVLAGKCPVSVNPNYISGPDPVFYDPDGKKGMNFNVRVKAIADGGVVVADSDGLHVIGATAVTLLLSAATSFNGYDKEPGTQGVDPEPIAEKRLAEAAKLKYGALRERHVSDYRKLFTRVSLDLGGDGAKIANLPTNDRVSNYGAKADPALVTLMFQYGRYLMIAGSRPGGQAMNLQGLWNQELRPPWSSNYTININTEMNYWPAEPANLAECHNPLFDFINQLSVNGARTAQVNYGMRGWVAHHNSDLWRQTAPVGDYGVSGDPVWASWVMGGAWLSTHLWEHYAFGRDKEFLKKEYPVIKGAAQFMLDWLVDDGAGHLVTNPCTSPEHKFIIPAKGKKKKIYDDPLLKKFATNTSSVTMACSMDTEIIHEIFTDCIAASEALGVDDDFRSRLVNARGKLLSPGITKDGRLMEWNIDFDDPEPQHRHFSHLFGVHPGSWITKRKEPALLEAAKTSLIARGDGGTGWSLGWKINQWARFGDGGHAFILINNMLRIVGELGVNMSNGGGVYPNLFDAHPPFQIDGNFAFTSGIIEMLLQSHEGMINLLPALPALEWPEGSVSGIRARGGFTVGIDWKDGRLAKATIRAGVDGPCRVNAGMPVSVAIGGKQMAFTTDSEGIIEFPAKAGSEYIIDGAEQK
ncbi:MAG: glycoside hydrolase N-terminal domain-containing protein [bacterium]